MYETNFNIKLIKHFLSNLTSSIFYNIEAEIQFCLKKDTDKEIVLDFLW